MTWRDVGVAQVIFKGEEGLDEGGVQKEFFQLIVRQMFDLNYGRPVLPCCALHMQMQIHTNCFHTFVLFQRKLCFQRLVRQPAQQWQMFVPADQRGRMAPEMQSFIDLYTNDVRAGMFTYDEDTRCFWFSSTALENAREFNLIGKVRMLGLRMS